MDDDGSTMATDTISSTGAFTLSFTTLGIDASHQIPGGYSLGQNYPNPFNPATRIRVSVEQAATFTIYNILGQEVASTNIPKAGAYQVNWGGGNNQGLGVAAGIYIYVLRSGGQAKARKMTLLDGGSGGPLSISGGTQSNGSSALGKSLSGKSIQFTKTNTTTLTLPIGAATADTSLGAITGNIGPTALITAADTVLATG